MQSSRLLRHFFPSLIWSIKSREKKLYLTFDDGPIPEVTPWVLETLKSFGAKATFFCIGDNIRKHPEIYRSVIEKGHATGNHTFNHLNGWKTRNEEYFNNISQCRQMVNSPLFRPPYGKLKPSQIRRLKKEYRIIMWDVLSRDYDINLDGKTCAENVIKNAGSGSIVVFHDSLKAEVRLRYALPRILEHFKKQGYSFDAIPGENQIGPEN